MNENADIDPRGYEGILTEIEQLARFYAPDWRFSPDKPDVGTALACVFARQLSETVARLSQTPKNHRLAFYNRLGASRLPASPASGVVCFSMAGHGMKGSIIPRDFKLFSPVIDGERHCFETQDDVFVTGAKCLGLVFTDPERDMISVWDDLAKPFVPGMENLQAHVLTFAHERIGNMDSRTHLYLRVKSRQANLWLEKLCDASQADWTIIHDGECHRLSCVQIGERLRLFGFPETLGAERRIGLRVHDAGSFEHLYMEELLLEAEGEGYEADAVCANGEVLTGKKRYPFGKAYAPYDEATFFCDQALRQKGALVGLTFTMGFDADETEEMTPITLPKKFIFKKREITPAKKPNVIIEQVVWEYFNGVGFAPLPLTKPAAKIFGGLDAMGDPVGPAEYRLEFTCPHDMTPLLSGAREGHAIRARISAASNAYKRPACIFSPWVTGVRFDYTYPGASLVTSGMIESSLEQKPLFPYPSPLFLRVADQNTEQSALYWRFDSPPAGGPIRMLVQCSGINGAALHEQTKNKARSAPCSWSFWSEWGWRPLSVDNRTDSFTQTGILSFTVTENMASRSLYGRGGYWLRASMPRCADFRIADIQLNATSVLQCETVSAEAFYADGDTRQIQLKNINIIDETVFVNENKSYAAPPDSPEDNWIPWAETGGAQTNASESPRVYAIDRARGVIAFSSALPNLTKSGRHTVMVRYRHGGGSAANLPAGQIFMPSLVVGYVNRAVNPLPLTGGAEQETTPDTLSRLGGALRHAGRPVTAGDFEDILNGPGIAKVKCRQMPKGELAIILLMKDIRSPHAFAEAKQRALQKLSPVLPAGLGVPDIRPPDFVSVSVTATLRLNGEDALAEAYQALRELCDPLHYIETNEIGTLPGPQMTANALVALPGVTGCDRLFVRYRMNSSEITTPPAYALPLNGEHVIIPVYETRT